MIQILVVCLALVSTVLGGERQKPEIVRAEFYNLDKDNDGFLNPDEIFEAYMDPPEQYAFIDLHLHDADKDGRLNLQEWLDLHTEEGDALAFDRTIDKDHDGYATFEELHQFYREASKLEADHTAKKLIAMGDKNGDGKLDFNEIEQLFAAKESLNGLFNKDDLKTADKNGDGSLDLEELEKFIFNSFAVRDEEIVHEDLEEGDKDNDGKISREEWVKYLCE